MTDGADTGAPPGRAASATAIVAGLATSRGFAAGPAFIYTKENVLSVPEYAIAESAVDAELARYREARAETRRQVEELVAKFKADTGYGLHQYIRSKRLLMARDLLKTDMPITQIAADVGFMDYSTFSRAFKSMFGCTPREYRNSQLK